MSRAITINHTNKFRDTWFGYQEGVQQGARSIHLQWEYRKEEREVPEKGSLTSVIESCGSAHSPLSLIHSCCAGAAHLNTDVCNLLGLQGPDHHHVYVAKLVSPNILQTNPWGPGLRPWDQAEERISDGAPGKVVHVCTRQDKTHLSKQLCNCWTVKGIPRYTQHCQQLIQNTVFRQGITGSLCDQQEKIVFLLK